jgi:regulator of replication initiation timing
MDVKSEVVFDLSKGEGKPVSNEAIRRFYTELADAGIIIKDARAALKEAIEGNEEIENIDREMKALKERRKQIIETNAVLVGFNDELKEAVSDRKDLIRDAKRDGIPRGEIALAEKALKKDLDMNISTEIYANIADLVEV